MFHNTYRCQNNPANADTVVWYADMTVPHSGIHAFTSVCCREQQWADFSATIVAVHTFMLLCTCSGRVLLHSSRTLFPRGVSPGRSYFSAIWLRYYSTFLERYPMYSKSFPSACIQVCMQIHRHTTVLQCQSRHASRNKEAKSKQEQENCPLLDTGVAAGAC